MRYGGFVANLDALEPAHVTPFGQVFGFYFVTVTCNGKSTKIKVCSEVPWKQLKTLANPFCGFRANSLYERDMTIILQYVAAGGGRPRVGGREPQPTSRSLFAAAGGPPSASRC